MASETRFAEVKKMLEAKGWRMVDIQGSHHLFVKSGARRLPIPVHHGKVKPCYVRMVRKLET